MDAADVLAGATTMMRGSMLLAALLSTAVQEGDAGASAGAFAPALQAYRAEDYQRSFERFAAMVQRDGEGAAPQARLNAALSALRLLRSRDAEELVAPLADVEGWRADAAFVLGFAARQHGERAVAAARLPDAEPMAWAMASRAFQRSELQFRAVVRVRPDWGAAVRNLERTLRRRAEVEAERDAATPKTAKQEPAPAPEPELELPTAAPEVVIPDVANSQLSAEELTQLQRRVRAQQREKVRGRQQRSLGRGAQAGRDW